MEMQKMQTRRHGFLPKLLFVIASFVLFGCPAHQQIFKKAEDFKAQRQFEQAAQSAMDALKLKPDYVQAKLLLQEVAPLAYQGRLQHAQGFEQATQFEKALSEYRELRGFVQAVNQYGVRFPTEDIEGKIRSMETGAAEQHYQAAENAFTRGDYSNAIAEYKETIRLQSSYKDAKEKLAEGYYRIGTDEFSKGLLRKAAENFSQSHGAIPNYKDAQQKAAEAFYILGNYFLGQGFCRNASKDLEAAQRIMPGYRDVSARFAQAEACAQDLIAFIPFQKKVDADMAGIALDDFIFEQVKSKVNSKGSKFIKVIEREQLERLVGEQGLRLQGIVEGSPVTKQLKGVNYLVFGKINQASLRQDPPRSAGKRVGYRQTYCRDVVKYNKKGEPYTVQVCDIVRDESLTYTEYSEAIEVALGGAISVVDARTGDVKINYQLDRRAKDAVVYADNPSVDPSQIDIPKEIQALFRQRRELRSRDEVIKTAIGQISDELTAKILSTVDSTAQATDPPPGAVADAIARGLGGSATPEGKPAAKKASSKATKR